MYKIFKKYCSKINYIELSNIPKFILSRIFKNVIKVYGLNSGKIISKLVKEIANNKGISNINEIKYPLYIPSVDLTSGGLIVFTSENKRNEFSDEIIYINDINISTAVRASCSFPGIFEPVKFENLVLSDGGIRENVPWRILKSSNCNKVLSIIFKESSSTNPCNNILDVLTNSFDILCHELSNYELNGTDYLLEIDTPHVSLLDYSKIDELYMLGYKQTKAYIKNNKSFINSFITL